MDINEQQLQIIVDAVLKLADEHQILYAHSLTLNQRINDLEATLHERSQHWSFLEGRLNELQRRISTQLSEVVELAESTATRVTSKIIGTPQQATLAPEVANALAAIQKSLKQ